MEKEFVIWTKFEMCFKCECVCSGIVHHQNDGVRVLVGRKKFDACDPTPGARRLE